MNLNLKNRIALYFISATGTLIVLLFLSIYFVVHNTVYDHLDSDLELEAGEIYRSTVVLDGEFIFANPFEWEEREHQQIEVNPTFIEVVDSSGQPLKKSGNLYEGSLPYHPLIKEQIFFNTSLNGDLIRMTQIPISNPHGLILGHLLIGVPLEDSQLVLTNLRTVLLIGFPIVLFVLFYLTRFIAGKIIAPVNRVISTAEIITRDNLEQRIDLPHHKDELYTLATTINDLLGRLTEALEREKQFTANASHELRTPLAIIKGTLEVLIRKPRKSEQYIEKIRYCIKETDRMSGLVDQLLILARHDAGKLKPKCIPLLIDDEIQSVIKRLETQILEKNINITFNNHNSEKIINTDPSLFGIILENLLSNSIKYSNPGGRIEIDFNKNEIFIKDNGPGISEEHLLKIFDPFYRVDEYRKSNIPGDGLGLAIVKKLSAMQNINIDVKSHVGAGTTFILGFPGNSLNQIV
ncbi:MAG: sensor histidine kinase [Calditrichaceae bacterium]